MKKSLLITVVLMFLTACSSTSYDTITLNEMDNFIEKGYKIVDVREPDEYSTGHISNAMNVPLSLLQQGEFAPLDRNTNYIIICRSGNRSKTASDILYNEGYTVVNTSEGMSSWTGEIE